MIRITRSFGLSTPDAGDLAVSLTWELPKHWTDHNGDPVDPLTNNILPNVEKALAEVSTLHGDALTVGKRLWFLVNNSASWAAHWMTLCAEPGTEYRFS